jgi:hypothetical protein
LEKIGVKILVYGSESVSESEKNVCGSESEKNEFGSTTLQICTLNISTTGQYWRNVEMNMSWNKSKL